MDVHSLHRSPGNIKILVGARLVWFAIPVAVLLSGCQSVHNAAGTPTTYNDPSAPPPLAQGVGIESQDIIGMTDQMMRDILSNPRLAAQQKPPRVIIDSEYFVNESASRINKNIITDRLRVELNRAAVGRMVFVGRHHAGMVEHERKIKRDGVADKGTVAPTAAQMGGDYRLGGRITSQDARAPKTGAATRFSQITFEMIDLESGEIVWSGMYAFSKSQQDDVIYR
ncbi:MAG: membrane lipoprotein lipid attachment site-like protein [Rhodospirillaceae bacterium]|nr:MAG: membrane lipoprotein lipid attachment site-like protein [Rhodospirillaceae bacterium]